MMTKGSYNGTKFFRIVLTINKNRGCKTGIRDAIYSALLKLGACSVSELAQTTSEVRICLQ
jgi:hypothetical protein